MIAILAMNAKSVDQIRALKASFAESGNPLQLMIHEMKVISQRAG
jgi:hypothetical protein